MANIKEYKRDFLNSILDRFFDEVNEIPIKFPIDLKETEDSFILQMEVPGINKEDIIIETQNNILKIYGEKKEEKREEEDNVIYSEIKYGKFERQFRLPDIADADKIDAIYQNGILKIVIPKKEEKKPKKISIKVK